MRIRGIIGILAALFVVINVFAAGGEGVHPPWPSPDPDGLKRWQDFRFGLFIHWGPVALTGHEIGWSRGKETPVDEYDTLYQRFNPENFDADEWVRIAKTAGMKYVVITTKHHDGFCLWPSAVTEYDIAATPFRRDVLAELSEACRKQGLLFGTYYSVCDWHHPDFPLGSPGGKSMKPDADLKAYDRYLRAQTRELVEHYGPLVTMWFDVPQVYGHEYGADMVRELRELQPDIIINNRAYAGAAGDYQTPEQQIGEFNRERPWETCMTLCRQWAWKPNDPMKTLEACLQTLIYTAGGDGNLLFNVGPAPDGRIETRQAERLEEMGQWLARYGDSIYGTRGGPYKPGKWGASTCMGDTITLFVMRWPATGALKLPPVDVVVTGASSTDADVEVRQTEDGLFISVPEDERDPIATVIRLTVDRDATTINPLKVFTPSDSLAFNKKAAASRTYKNNHREFGAARAFDDDEFTRWATDSGTSACWLEVDLGKPREIGQVFIDERNWNRVRKFEVQVRQAGTWQTVLQGTTIGSDFHRNITPVTARRIRLHILEATDGPTIWEFQLFGVAKSDSLAFSRKAVASNIFMKNEREFGAARAFDDDKETRWATDSGTSACRLEVDLGKAQEIGQVFIDEGDWNRIRKFEVQVKQAGTWQTVLEGTTIGPGFVGDITPVTARYVRLNILEATDGPTIWEFQVYSSDEP